MRRHAALAMCAACSAPVVPSAPVAPVASLTVAIYRDLAVVDDRRWLDVGDALVLDRIAPDAPLASLVIEAPGLRIGACARDRTVSILRCAVTGARGRHFVRVLQIAPSLRARAQHDLAMIAPDRATVATRYAIPTPRWNVSGAIVLYDGAPGTTRELARGAIRLDGGTAILVRPDREIPARIVAIYDGMVRGVAQPAWGDASQSAVWEWLELAAPLPPGAVHANVRDRDLRIAAEARTPARIPLWIDPTLRGTRTRTIDAALVEHVELSVANLGDAPREVWLAEPLRPERRRRIVGGAPVLDGDTARLRVTIAPRAIERAAFAIAYDR